MNVIETAGLGKRYRSQWALRDCVIAVPEGEVTALVGPNGADKTTLLELLAGLHFEAGTFRFAWTQELGRRAWLTWKLGLLAGAAVPVAAGLGALFSYASRSRRIGNGPDTRNTVRGAIYGGAMPPLPRITGREVVKALGKLGWEVVIQKGSHAQLKHPSRGGRVTVPLHAGETIGPGLLRSILNQADITVEEFRGAL